MEAVGRIGHSQISIWPCSGMSSSCPRFGGLLLLATSSGNGEMVAKLADTAKESGKNNVAFLSHFILGDLEQCLDVLIQSGRLPEAAFFARTYLPSQISKVLPQWKEQLAKVSEKPGQSLADPNEYKNLFPNFDQTLATEKALCIERQRKMPANMFTSVPDTKKEHSSPPPQRKMVCDLPKEVMQPTSV